MVAGYKINLLPLEIHHILNGKVSTGEHPFYGWGEGSPASSKGNLLHPTFFFSKWREYLASTSKDAYEIFIDLFNKGLIKIIHQNT
jgi:hypothetical protein